MVTFRLRHVYVVATFRLRQVSVAANFRLRQVSGVLEFPLKTGFRCGEFPLKTGFSLGEFPLKTGFRRFEFPLKTSFRWGEFSLKTGFTVLKTPEMSPPLRSSDQQFSLPPPKSVYPTEEHKWSARRLAAVHTLRHQDACQLGYFCRWRHKARAFCFFSKRYSHSST